MSSAQTDSRSSPPLLASGLGTGRPSGHVFRVDRKRGPAGYEAWAPHQDHSEALQRGDIAAASAAARGAATA
jgi:hypothetical protein